MSESTVAAVTRLLRGHRYHHANERELQDGIEAVLRDAKIAFEREKRLAEGDIIDFLVDGGLGVEVKVGGGLAAVTRQLHRYAENAAVTELLLVSSRLRLGQVPIELRGKRVHFLALLGGLL